MRRASLRIAIVCAITAVAFALTALPALGSPLALRTSPRSVDGTLPASFSPFASDGWVFWTGLTSSGATDFDVFGLSPTGDISRISDASTNDFSSRGSAGYALWLAFDGAESHVWSVELGSGLPASRLDPGSDTSRELVVREGMAAWTGFDGVDDEIFVWDSSNATVIQVTDNDYDDSGPVITSDGVAWIAYEQADGDVRFLAAGGSVPDRVTDDAYEDLALGMSDGWIAWISNRSGIDFALVYSGTATHNLGRASREAPAVSNGMVAWLDDSRRVMRLLGNPATGAQPQVVSTTSSLNQAPSFDRDRLSWIGLNASGAAEVFATDVFGPTPLALSADVTKPFGQTSSDAGLVYWTGANGGDHIYGAESFSVERHAGTDRYATAAAVSNRSYPGGAETVLLATGTNYPDALCGGPLGVAMDSPILLTRPGGLSQAASAEILRLGAKKVIILGGTGAVSAQVEEDLLNIGLLRGDVERLAGVDRYETSKLIALRLRQEMGAKWPASPTGLITTGQLFPDALASSAVGSRQAWPVFLTRAASLPNSTREGIDQVGIAGLYVVGGVGAVSESALSGLPVLDRIGGVDRYETASMLADRSLSEGWLERHEICLSRGDLFPDALVGAILAGETGSVMILTRVDLLPGTTEAYLADRGPEAMRTHILGGVGAVSESVESRVTFLMSGGEQP